MPQVQARARQGGGAKLTDFLAPGQSIRARFSLLVATIAFLISGLLPSLNGGR